MIWLWSKCRLRNYVHVIIQEFSFYSKDLEYSYQGRFPYKNQLLSEYPSLSMVLLIAPREGALMKCILMLGNQVIYVCIYACFFYSMYVCHFFLRKHKMLLTFIISHIIEATTFQRTYWDRFIWSVLLPKFLYSIIMNKKITNVAYFTQCWTPKRLNV